jgi:hypothetical protein
MITEPARMSGPGSGAPGPQCQSSPGPGPGSPLRLARAPAALAPGTLPTSDTESLISDLNFDLLFKVEVTFKFRVLSEPSFQVSIFRAESEALTKAGLRSGRRGGTS